MVIYPRLRLAVAVLALGIGLVATAQTQTQTQTGQGDEAVSRGRQIYREGVLPSGQNLTGMAQAGVVRTGRDAACIACHRRSGFGTAEGSFVIRPIVGSDLYQTRPASAATPSVTHWKGRPQRPAYDDETLARAIRTGIDVTGQPMQSAMPRYALNDGDMMALQAYLKTLYVRDAEGVSETDIHLATVIQPDVPPAKRRAMLDVLEAFVRIKNAGVRSEETRRTAGFMRMHRAYRKWVLHVWELTGPPQSWNAQLEQAYRRQPVFALVAGMGSGSWQPIHEFSERLELPSVLPMTDLPGSAGENFYTVYFSRGIALEADALAQFVARQGHKDSRIVQVFRPGQAGEVAAKAFETALAGTELRVESLALRGEGTESFWRGLSGTARTTVVAWLGAPDLPPAHWLRAGDAMPVVYLSATLLDGELDAHGIPAMLTYPWDLPGQREARVLRSNLWLRAQGLEAKSEQLQAVAINTLFAITVAGDALSHLQDSFSRDSFVERVEHNITTTVTPTFYPYVSLGPGRRFAAKGAYIVRPRGAPPESLAAVSEWIVP